MGTEFAESFPRFSPDGRWIAYESNETGRREIYLRTFPDAGRKWPVSTDGGTLPRWSRDGKEIFYRNGEKMLAVDIEPSRERVLGKPKLLFERHFPAVTTVDVASDGRFVVIEDTASALRPRELVLVQNFHTELERLVPTQPR